jgi:hypothetical protein
MRKFTRKSVFHTFLKLRINMLKGRGMEEVNDFSWIYKHNNNAVTILQLSSIGKAASAETNVAVNCELKIIRRLTWKRALLHAQLRENPSPPITRSQ